MADDIDSKKPEEQESANEAEATIETVSAETEALAEDTDVEKETTSKIDDDLLSMLKNNNSLLQEIKGVIQNRLEYDAVKEKVIDKINDELKFYRDGFIFKSQKSIFIDLMLLYDSLERILISVAIEGGFSREKLVEHLEIFKEELLELLYRRDITPFDEHPEVLNYKLHKTVKTIPTDEESENNKVDKIIKIGFRLNDKILRPEEVIIKKYVKSKEDRQ